MLTCEDLKICSSVAGKIGLSLIGQMFFAHLLDIWIFHFSHSNKHLFLSDHNLHLRKSAGETVQILKQGGRLSGKVFVSAALS